MSDNISRRPAGTPAGGQFAGRTGTDPDVTLDTATQPFRLPRTIEHYRAMNGDGATISLQDRINDLGWSDVRFINLRGDAVPDVEGYFTPSWHIAVRSDVADGDLLEALNSAARADAAANGLEDDEAEMFVDDFGGHRAFGEVSARHLADAGIVECWQDSSDDPFSHLHVDEL